jgi:hypothetical protein
MSELFTDVNASQASAEGSQTDTTATQTETGEQAALATQPVKQPQSREDNAAFAEMRRQKTALEKELATAKQRADQIVATGWGDSWGVKSADEWDAYCENLKFEQEHPGVSKADIDKAVDERLQNHPLVLASKAAQMDALYTTEAAKFARTFPELNITDGASLRELVDADEALSDAVNKRDLSPVQAYWALHGEEIVTKRAEKAEQDAIAKIQQNAAATPGALGAGADAPLTLTEGELKKLDPKRLRNDPAYFAAAQRANQDRFKQR